MKTINVQVPSVSRKAALVTTVILPLVLVLALSVRRSAVSAMTAGQAGSAKGTIVKRSDALVRTVMAPVFVLEKTVSR